MITGTPCSDWKNQPQYVWLVTKSLTENLSNVTLDGSVDTRKDGAVGVSIGWQIAVGGMADSRPVQVTQGLQSDNGCDSVKLCPPYCMEHDELVNKHNDSGR